MEVVFLNTKEKKCGVYQYGKHVYEILSESVNTLYYYTYYEIGNIDEYLHIMSLLNTSNVYAIIYNYHCGPMWFITKQTILSFPNIQNIVITHEEPISFFDKFIFVFAQMKENLQIAPTYFWFPRPIYKVLSSPPPPFENKIFEYFCSYGQELQLKIPIFGSFGFGLWGKGFTEIIEIVNSQYDRAIIKLFITKAHYGNDDTYLSIIDACLTTPKKKGIELLLYHDFVSTTDLLHFISLNTANLFPYDITRSGGNSSVIDYALSSNTPFGISSSVMFEHIYHPCIDVYKTPLPDIIANSLPYLEKYKELYSNDIMRSTMIHILES